MNRNATKTKADNLKTLDQAEGFLFEFATACLAFLTRCDPLRKNLTTLYFLYVVFFGGRSGARHRPLCSQ
jgi:hypothetical protein